MNGLPYVSRGASIVVLCVAACAQPQHPYHFVAVTGGPEAPMDVAIRVFAANGLSPSGIDRAGGVVRSQWEDTGYRYGFVHGRDATLFRQYVVTIVGAPTGSDVTLRADEMRCAGGARITDQGPVGLCEEIHALVPPHQEQLDALGARLRAGLSAP